jgi:hypothetical protein
VDLGSLQLDDVDIGEVPPARCVRQTLWMSNVDGLRFAVLIGRGLNVGLGLGIQVEIATPAGDAGPRFSERFFDTREKDISQGSTHHGKIISLEEASITLGELAVLRCTGCTSCAVKM